MPALLIRQSFQVAPGSASARSAWVPAALLRTVAVTAGLRSTTRWMWKSHWSCPL